MQQTPPVPYLHQIANHCPEAMSLYLGLWQRQDLDGHVHCKKEDIKREFLFSKTKFENKLLPLLSEGLVSVIYDSPQEIEVELVGWGLLED